MPDWRRPVTSIRSRSSAAAPTRRTKSCRASTSSPAGCSFIASPNKPSPLDLRPTTPSSSHRVPADPRQRGNEGDTQFIQNHLDAIFSEDLHAKRVKSLTNGTLGVMTSASLAVSIIGQSLAQARGLLSKHAIKQVDRLLSNQGIVVWDMFAPWVAEIVGQRKTIVVAMDWTDFDADDQTTLALNLITNHGRATPLLWLTVLKDELKDKRNDYEDLCLARLAEVLPEGVAVTILADRGFGDTKLFAYLETLGFAYVIRFRGNIHVSAADGETRAAAAWVGTGGRARKLRDPEVTAA